MSNRSPSLAQRTDSWGPGQAGDARSNRLQHWVRRASWTTHPPAPGTLGSQWPEPEIVTAARVMVDDGLEASEVIAEIVELVAGDRQMLAEAVIDWVRRIGRGPSDDFAALAALRFLERALRQIPREDSRS